MRRFHGTIDYLPGGREAVVALTDGRGDWFGAERVALPRAKHGKRALYEQGYAAASVKATTLKLPPHWTGASASALRWLGSGGSPLVLGHCSAICPRGDAPSPKRGKESRG